MKTFLTILIAILTLAGVITLLAFLSNLYNWVKRKNNRPQIGHALLFYKILKRGDYVSINGKVLCFSHIASEGQTINPLYPALEKNKTVGGEVAFRNSNELGYLYYNPSTLKHCEFIYGKYGVKWAASEHWASVAKEKVEEYIYT